MTQTRRAAGLTGTLALAALLVAGGAIAQSGPPLNTMPPPPSSSDPTPKDGAKPKPSRERKTPRARTTEDTTGTTDGGTAAARPKRSGTAATTTYDRPTRYVPEEFDNGSGGGERAAPFISQSGRPGLGLKF